MISLFGGKNKNLKNEDRNRISEYTGEELVVYILTEKNIRGLEQYVTNKGLPVQKAYTDIEEVKITMLIESRPCRLIVIEAGLGRFVSTAARNDIIDLFGLCNGVDKKLSVFYTNSLLKSDALKAIGKKNKDILWYNYYSTYNVIEETLKLNEKYVSTKVCEDLDFGSVLDYTGKLVPISLDKYGDSIFKSSIVYEVRGMVGNAEDLPSYSIKI